ncbi:hypothetical protein [Pedobacter panaciterrae]
MEPFEINLVGEVLTVIPQPDGSFTIFNGDDLLGTIAPNYDESDALRWPTVDLMGVDYAQQVGELIDEHEM